jgi:hypothetical protein
MLPGRLYLRGVRGTLETLLEALERVPSVRVGWYAKRNQLGHFALQGISEANFTTRLYKGPEICRMGQTT